MHVFRMRRLGAVAVMLLAAACNFAPPLPSASSIASAPSLAVASPLPADLLAPPPPSPVQQALSNSRIEFRPLTDDELPGVDVTRREAISTALAFRGLAYDPGDGSVEHVVIWKKAGCVFLGMYENRLPLPHASPGPPFPAYLVQVLADPIPDFSKLNIAVVVVDARTGAQGSGFSGGGPSPYGAMGTTRRVKP